MCLTALGICKALPGLQEIPFSRLCHGRQADRHRASQAPGTEWGAVQDLPGMALSGCLKNLRAQPFSSGMKEHSLPPKRPSWQTSLCPRPTPNSVPPTFLVLVRGPGSFVFSCALLCLLRQKALPPMSPRVRGRASFHALWFRGPRATPQQVPLVDRKHPH